MRMPGAMLAIALTAPVAFAQPVTDPSTNAPLADIRDDKQLAEVLAAITQDPGVRVADPKLRPLAAALMLEGVRQLQAHAYEQALANFLDAYDKLPSPKILLNIGSTLRDMGRLADAANTYQRYLADPATGPERVEEVKTLLVDLDKQLTLLTVHVQPKGSDLSIDGGPFIAVGSSLVARVRPGIHLVRVRNGGATGEVTVNGFEGELKDVTATVTVPAPAPAPDAKPLPTVRTHEGPPHEGPAVIPPDQHYGWLDTSTQYGTSDPTSTQRQVNTGFSGPPVAAIIPRIEDDEVEQIFTPPAKEDIHSIAPGVMGLMRIDGKLRGVAAGVGLAVSALDSLEVELAVLRSNQWGMYGGLRLRILTGYLRPYVAVGLPGFLYEDENDGMKTKLAAGFRAAGGLEVRINGHLSLQGDLGIEYFVIDPDALVGGKHPETIVFVPTIGVIGRL